ncbi:protein FAF-like, chloroplastic [Magnolia sinica]|uniref:protein FAF-like, chloroplastic n=1 Tax=Magnolia sinica TaxID=86752 RepID=UPI00265AA135|nr:protein FAF-like, chloroplastic [Magnolia sinica]
MSSSSPSAVCKGLRSSSLHLQQEMKVRGIGSILGFSEEKQRISEKRESLRRTFSADMSSKKWLAQNLPLELRKTASSEELKLESDKEKRRGEMETPGKLDIWSSILSEKPNSASQAPYIHPLVKQSASSLSKKSLEICTESLGSETGSDGFSSSSEDGDFSLSDVSENEQETEQEKEGCRNVRRELGAVNYNCSMNRRSTPRSFPPPLPSISRRDGPCLHMRPHRKDGRLVLEAVPVTSHNYLHVEREGGRLRLSFVNALTKDNNKEEVDLFESDREEEEEEEEENISKEESSEPEFEEDVEDISSDEDKEEGEEIKEAAYVDRGMLYVAADRMMKVHRSASMMNKFMGVYNKNLNPWSNKKPDEKDDPTRIVARLAPPSTPFNTYECWWRNGHAAVAARSLELPQPKKPVLLNTEDLAYVRRCEQPRKSTLDWKTRCIATS